jgi:hypothetical protein
MPNVKVIRSLRRSYGYSLQWVGPNPPTWIMGPNHTWAWYRYKRDALAKAAIYNGGTDGNQEAQ